MSAQKTISNSFTVTTMEDPVSVQAQYAPNNNPTAGQIHNVWQDGDLYMRTRETDSNVWSSWHKIVGESGGETDYTFGISAYKTTANASTAPSDITSWADAPMAVTSSKPYLWAKVQQKSWNASTQSYDVDSTRYIRLTGEDGASVLAQYAPNDNPSSSQIHDTWQSGDLYMRTKSTSDSSWSSWHKIVGESGGETDFTFNISKNKTSSSATTAPSDCYYQNWQDAPVAPTSTYPYLWMKIVEKTWNASTQSYDSGTARYARVTGEAGANAPYIELSRTTILYNANNEGKSTASQNFQIAYALKVNGNTCTISSVDNITISLPSNVTVVSGTKTTSGCTINCTHSVVMSGVITITITGTYNGQTYTASGSITVEANKEGAQGEKGDTGDQGGKGDRGKIGRFYYYAQVWTNSSSVSYAVTDTEAPFFSYNNQYWVFNPESNGTYTMSSMGTPSSSNENWKLMVTDFKFIIAQAIFSNYGHLGSFIVNNDWLISQYGKVNNAASANYQAFDPNFPETPYVCQGASVNVNYNNVGTFTLTAGKTYVFYVEGESFSSTTAQLKVRIANSSNSDVSSVLNLTSSSPTGTITYTPSATATYHLRVDMQLGGQTSDVTSYINNIFIPNFAVDGLTGKSYMSETHVKGVVESVNEEMGNTIRIDAKKGDFSMIGPTSIMDDDWLPSGNARETLAQILFAHDPDTLTRLAYMILQNGHKNRVINIDPYYGFSIENSIGGTSDTSRGGIGEGGCRFTYGSDSWYEEGNYGVRKMSLQYGSYASSRKLLEIDIDGITYKEGSTTKTKTWAQLLG